MMRKRDTISDLQFDVAICGAGVAGLTLARQLMLQSPELELVVIDKLLRPLPEAAFKVGESTVEVGAHYLRNVIGLSDYLPNTHIKKLGLRFFFRGPGDRFEDRPELGLSDFASVDSYQIDRGVLENDLRALIAKDGAVLLEGCRVDDIHLAKDDDLHTVEYTDADGARQRIAARWVIDAMSRRRLLQKKLGLTKDRKKKCSAVWFRIDGRVDVDDLVPSDRVEWHDRVVGNNRYHSTNHLMGDGYWVWLIPLPTGCTSIGIVVLEELHSFSELNNFERAMRWLEAHESALAAHLVGREPMDFRCMRRYSYSSRQIMSTQRWACVGEAATFPDPFYSPGIDLIGFANSIVAQLVQLDRQGDVTEQLVRQHNRFILALNDGLTLAIQSGYPFFGDPIIMSCKVIWDIARAWALLGPQMFNGIFLDGARTEAVAPATAGAFTLTLTTQHLFGEWASKSKGRFSFEFIDYLSLPFLSELRERNLQPGKSTEELVADQVANMKILEELSQVFFLLAVEDCLAERMGEFQPPVWLNAWSLSLDPQRWPDDGLFKPESEPRDLQPLLDQIRGLFHAQMPEARITTPPM